MSMHRTLLPALVFSLGLAHTLAAQPAASRVETLTRRAHTVQFVGGVDARVTQLFGETAVLTGGRIGLLLDQRTLLAFSARANLNQNLDTGHRFADGRTAGLSFGYGGVEIGRLLRPTRALHVAASVLLGGGATSYHDRRWREGDGDDQPVDGFWLVEPEVQLQANVTSMMRVALGGSYRVVHGARLAGPADADLRGASASLTLTFGRF